MIVYFKNRKFVLCYVQLIQAIILLGVSLGFLLIRALIPSFGKDRPHPQPPSPSRQSISSAETALVPAGPISAATLQNNRKYADRSYMDIVSVLATTVSCLITGHKVGYKKLEIENLMKEPNVYNYEKIISLLSKQEHEQVVKISAESEPIRKLILERVSMITKIHKLRGTIATQCFIGIVGPQNSGKTTFINKMWRLHLPTGNSVHTEKITIQKRTDTVQVVDYPGNNSLDSHSKLFSIFGAMNNLVVINIETSGQFLLKYSQENVDSTIYRIRS